MRKIITIVLFSAFLMMSIFSFTSTSMAQDGSKVTEREAKKVGFFQIFMDMKASPISLSDDKTLMDMAKKHNFNTKPLIESRQASPWKGKKIYLGSAIEVYDANDSL